MLDDILARLGALPADQRREIEKLALDATKDMKWIPNAGPQTDAYFSPADILLYGGQGGGGKSDLGLGLAFTAHKRSLILRRKYTNLGSLIERAITINGSRDGFNGSAPPLLRTSDNRYIQFAGNQHLGDEQDWQGQPFDLKVFDEAVQFLELQIRFHLGWLRSTEPGQRVRAVLATNPPVDADGDWIIGMFRPWLDITHPKPAKHGELRWYVTGPDGKDMEVAGPAPVELPGQSQPAIPMSRTFIPAELKDNPYLIDTGYQSKLDGLPEPLRSAVRDGNFMAARQDDEWQVIPTAWVIAAQARWKPDGHRGVPMTAIGLDVGAGRDKTVASPRHGGWYAEQKIVSGPEAKDEGHAAALIVRNRKDGCPVIVDVGGGFGGPSAMVFKENEIPFVRFNAADGSTRKSRDGAFKFYNKRAEAFWMMREELDPEQIGGSPIALPPDPELLADLTSARWEMTTRGIKVESKEDIKARIGRSPDKGDSALMALSEGEKAAARAVSRSASNMPSQASTGHTAAKRYRR